MYKNCREELLAVMRAFVIETGENEFSRAEAIAAMRRSGGKYPEGTVSAHLTYRCCANIPTRCYKPMYDDYEKIGSPKQIGILTLVIYNGIISTINKKKEHIECKVKK